MGATSGIFMQVEWKTERDEQLELRDWFSSASQRTAR
jgi:hypothetical protein